MIFVLRMAGRELRASWRRLLFFFACIAVGVAAIVTIRSLVGNVRTALVGEARSLTAADVVLSTNRPWTAATHRVLAERLRAFGVRDRIEAISVDTMVRPTGSGRAAAKLVELRGVEPPFPYYGTVVLQSGRPYSHELVRGRGVLVRSELLAALGQRVGDSLLIGGQPYTIRDVVVTEPGRRPGAFSLGPPVLMDRADLVASGLLRFGTRARYEILLRVPEPAIAALVDDLRRGLRNEFVRIRSYRSTEDSLGQSLLRAENYLSLVGLVIVVLGGLGVSSVVRVFVQQKMKAIAVLKCVGGRNAHILAIYLVQVLAMGLAGSLLGVGLARGAVAAVPALVGPLPVGTESLHVGLTWPAVLQGIGSGALVSLLFALVPLMQVRHIKPSLLLRAQPPGGGRDWCRIGVTAMVAAALIALAAWQAASLKVGVSVSAGLVVAAAALHLAGRGLIRAVTPLAWSSSFVLRHAALRLVRPGNQTRVVLLVVGLGSLFTIGVRLLQANILRELALEVREGSPDMFLIDIQRDQIDGVLKLVGRAARESPRPIPVLRARVTAVQGRNVTLDDYDDVRGRGSLGREYVVTYRPALEENEQLIAGAFWPEGRLARPEVSIEEAIRDRFRIDVGDDIRFDILGRIITARVASVRRVDWRDSRRGGFMFVFRPGVLEQAPHGFILPARGPVEGGRRARLQHDLAAAFPNVSVIDVRELLETARRVVNGIALALSVVGVVVLLSGGLILVGAISTTKFQRIYDAAVLKTLGASSRTIAALLVLEYGVLGLLAGTIGSAGAAVLGWGVSRFALDLSWEPLPGVNAAGLLLTSALVTVIGVGASVDVLWRKPLTTLRAE